MWEEYEIHTLQNYITKLLLINLVFVPWLRQSLFKTCLIKFSFNPPLFPIQNREKRVIRQISARQPTDRQRRRRHGMHDRGRVRRLRPRRHRPDPRALDPRGQGIYNALVFSKAHCKCAEMRFRSPFDERLWECCGNV